MIVTIALVLALIAILIFTGTQAGKWFSDSSKQSDSIWH